MKKDKTEIQEENLTMTDDVIEENLADEKANAADKIADLTAKLKRAEESEKRALADYQNLVRRAREEKMEWLKMANASLVGEFIAPLQNLSHAAKALDDQGLNMVIQQFWQTLNELGVVELGEAQLIGQNFDVEKMEAVEKNGESEKVIKVISPGYQLHDKILQHAKVSVG